MSSDYIGVIIKGPEKDDQNLEGNIIEIRQLHPTNQIFITFMGNGINAIGYVGDSDSDLIKVEDVVSFNNNQEAINWAKSVNLNQIRKVT